jgi:hypothetical protein
MLYTTKQKVPIQKNKITIIHQPSFPYSSKMKAAISKNANKHAINGMAGISIFFSPYLGTVIAICTRSRMIW